MKKKKLTLNKLTLGYLTDLEQREVKGGSGASSNIYVNSVCVTPTTNSPTNIFDTCPNPFTNPTTSSCKTIPYHSCSI